MFPILSGPFLSVLWMTLLPLSFPQRQEFFKLHVQTLVCISPPMPPFICPRHSMHTLLTLQQTSLDQNCLQARGLYYQHSPQHSTWMSHENHEWHIKNPTYLGPMMPLQSALPQWMATKGIRLDKPLLITSSSISSGWSFSPLDKTTAFLFLLFFYKQYLGVTK